MKESLEEREEMFSENSLSEEEEEEIGSSTAEVEIWSLASATLNPNLINLI